MFASTRGSIIARLLALGAVSLFTMGAQSSCSSGDDGGRFVVGDPEPGKGTRTGPTFSVTLTLKDSAGRVTNRFSRGEIITFELTVLNRTNAAIQLHLPTMSGNQDFKVFAAGANDNLWDWTANRLFATVITDVTFEAGGTHVFSGTWDQELLDGTILGAGTYEATGQWFAVPGQQPPLTEGDTLSPRVRFIVN
jgi:hypothetical protein